MLGAIIGDVVGSRWEFHPTNDYDFEWLSGKNDFTDDTVCTVAVADALIHKRSFQESVHDWCRRYPCPMGGYGGRFLKWVLSNDPKPYGSFGNGSAMRVSPVAYWYDDKDSVLEAARKTAIITHSHPEGVKGAQTVALAIFKALELNRGGCLSAPCNIDEILQECVRFSGYDLDMRRSSVENRFDETCPGTVPVALKIIGMSRNFEDAVRLSVSLGTDADTLGAIVGSIAEAIWGIPEEMRKRIEDFLPHEMLSVIKAFEKECPGNRKPLVDNVFSDSSCTDAMPKSLKAGRHDGVDEEIRSALLLKMEERAKARESW